MPPGLERFYAQTLSWGGCVPFATGPDDRSAFADARYECARLQVPLDYAAPTGRTAELGVLRRKAEGKGAGQRIGSLVVNPGGPGVSGMSAVPALFGGDGPAVRELAGRFDVVGLDPRGVGASTPTIDCLTDAEREVERADLDIDPSPAGVAATEQENQQYAQRCTERVGADVLANVGTRDAARDLDVLRAALGDPKLTFLGYSYGTRLGSTYAEEFPQNVRALVLDGALDPNQSTIDRSVAQAAGFQSAFDAFAADCATRRNCPLGTDRTQAVAKFQALTRPLIDRPLAVGDRTLGYADTITGVTQALYVSSAWPALTQGLSGLAKGDGTILLLLADIYDDRHSDGSYGNALEAFEAISCVDEQRTTDPAAVADGAPGSWPPRRTRTPVAGPSRRATSACSGRSRPRAPRTARRSRACRRRWSCRPRATRPPRTRPASTSPPRWAGPCCGWRASSTGRCWPAAPAWTTRCRPTWSTSPSRPAAPPAGSTPDATGEVRPERPSAPVRASRRTSRLRKG